MGPVLHRREREPAALVYIRRPADALHPLHVFMVSGKPCSACRHHGSATPWQEPWKGLRDCVWHSRHTQPTAGLKVLDAMQAVCTCALCESACLEQRSGRHTPLTPAPLCASRYSVCCYCPGETAYAICCPSAGQAFAAPPVYCAAGLTDLPIAHGFAPVLEGAK